MDFYFYFWSSGNHAFCHRGSSVFFNLEQSPSLFLFFISWTVFEELRPVVVLRGLSVWLCLSHDEIQRKSFGGSTAQVMCSQLITSRGTWRQFVPPWLVFCWMSTWKADLRSLHCSFPPLWLGSPLGVFSAGMAFAQCQRCQSGTGVTGTSFTTSYFVNCVFLLICKYAFIMSIIYFQYLVNH